MSAFIRTIEGKVLSVTHGKKELSLSVEEVLVGETKEKNIDFSVDPNVRITNTYNQPTKLVALKVGQTVEIGYSRDKSKRTALFIKVVR